MTHSKMDLAVGILLLVAFVAFLIRLPSARGTGRNGKISIILFMLFLLLGGLGYVLSIRFLRDVCWVALMVLVVNHWVYGNGRSRQDP
jgi:hypothetical protein